jgi:NhaA family Na+:H+ antiporter
VVPSLIHFALNAGSPTQPGMGIPMATDIAFALGALAMLGSRVPTSLKVFLVALAVMDDLFAVIVIAVFYTSDLSLAMWIFMYRSGVHATLTGVLLAFAIPFRGRFGAEDSPSHGLEHFLHKPVAFAVLPLFALANTGIVIGAGALDGLFTSNSLGILAGLVLGKPLGITLACVVGVALGLCRLPADLRWKHIVGAGMLGGIGFTMSIFITNLAFAGQAEVINSSKLAILVGSVLAGLAGCVWLLLVGRTAPESNGPAAA